MYKGLGKKVAMYPGIAKPTNDKDVNWTFIIYFFRKGDNKIVQKKIVRKNIAPQTAINIAKKIYKNKHLNYVVVIYKYSYDGPEAIFEMGDESVQKQWLAQQFSMEKT